MFKAKYIAKNPLENKKFREHNEKNMEFGNYTLAEI